MPFCHLCNDLKFYRFLPCLLSPFLASKSFFKNSISASSRCILSPGGSSFSKVPSVFLGLPLLSSSPFNPLSRYFLTPLRNILKSSHMFL